MLNESFKACSGGGGSSGGSATFGSGGGRGEAFGVCVVGAQEGSRATQVVVICSEAGQQRKN